MKYNLLKLTKQQAIIITGYTGFTACHFVDFHEDVERRVGHPVFTHQFGDAGYREYIKDLYKEDFLAMCPLTNGFDSFQKAIRGV